MKPLITEQVNSNTRDIDQLSTLDLAHRMNQEDRRVAESITPALPAIARAIDQIAERLVSGGHLFYIGTGTSGRLGVLDAVECPPTFGVSPELVQAIIAGGYDAMHKATEAAEDDPQSGALAIRQRRVTSRDAVVGITASGRTPFTIGALAEARALGALTISLACNPNAEISAVADTPIELVTGPEVIAGSTRMKAGTAQKLVLNMLSTGVMIRLGYTYGNLMSNLQLKNEKLRRRARDVLLNEFGLSEEAATALLAESGNDLKAAILMHRTGVSAMEARAALESSGHSIKRALQKQK